MVGEEADGLDYSTTNGYLADDKTYLSFSISEPNDGITGDFFTERFVLGTMRDLKNPGVLSLSLTGAALHSNVGTILENDYVDNNHRDLGTYANAIMYTASANGYNLYFVLDLDTNQLELIALRPEGTAQADKILITLNLSGINGEISGEHTILNDFNVLLHNYKVISNYEYNSDSQVYAYYYVNLEEDNKFVNVKNQTGISYEFAGGTYTVDNELRTLAKNENTNELFTFTPLTKRLTMRAVGQDSVVADLKFNVVVDGYVVDQLTYKMNIQRNLQFMVNGAESVVKDQVLETNFVLTPVLTTGNPYYDDLPIKVDFKNNTNVADVDVSATGYYRVLALDLYKLKIKDKQIQQCSLC
jgi:hypothetical protein